MATVNYDKRTKRWKMRFDVPSGDGKRKQKMITCGPNVRSRSAALKMLAEYQVQLNHGTYHDPSDVTVGEYLEQWLSRKTARLSPSTIHAYKANIKYHIVPAIGAQRLVKLKAANIQSLYDDLAGRLSPKTVKNIHGILHSAFQQALRLDMIESNPASRVEPPVARRKPIQIATEEDRVKLLAAITTSKYRIPILIALATGARRGEVLALKWEDYDQEQRLLAIRRSVIQVKGALVVKGTKTDRERVIAIPKSLAAALDEHKRSQESHKGVLGSAYKDGGWICAHSDGAPLTPGGIDRAFYRIRTETGIGITLHGLRHTAISEQLAAGIPSHIVSKRAGHSTIATTHDIYGHMMPHYQEKAVEVAEGLMNPQPKIKIIER